MRRNQVGIGVAQQHGEHSEVSQRSQQTSTHDDGLAADLVRQGAKHDEERCTNNQCGSDQQIGSLGVHLGDRRQEEQRVELAGVPHHSLTSGQTDQRQNHDLQVLPLTERFGEWGFRSLAFGLHFGESGRLVHGQADIHRHAQQQNGHQERNTPAPDIKVCAGQLTRYQNHDQGQEEPQGSRGLNPSGIGTAFAMGRVLGHISGGTTVFTAQGQSL